MAITVDMPRARPCADLRVRDVPARVGESTVSLMESKSALNRPTGVMREVDFTLNPYSGCYFGCTYCYAAFFAYDVGLQETWGDWTRVKGNMAELLHRKLQRSPGFLDGKMIYMSSATDPYQPVERKVKLTRRILEVLAGCVDPDEAEADVPVQGALGFEETLPPDEVSAPRPKLVVQTRSPIVARDIDLFRQIDANGGRVRVNMTVTSDLANDEDVRRAFEPGCPSVRARLAAIAEVQAAGVRACITMTPLLLVDDVDLFADDLLVTGVTRFIMHPLNFHKVNFVAQTGRDAFELMADRLGCEGDEFIPEYFRRYEEVREGLKARLVDEAGCKLTGWAGD